MLFRPARASDIDEICALLATAKLGPDHFHAAFMADPRFDPAQIRLAWTGGHIVACAKIYPRTLRIGSVVTPIGGISNVRTDPRFWRKGLATSLLSECLSTMFREGMTLAPLFSKRHELFARRGWFAIAEAQLEIPVEALVVLDLDAPTGVTVRPFDGHDLDAVMALHESANAGRTGTVVRERDDWLGRLTLLDLQGAAPLVAEREGEIAGFAWTQPHGATIEALELLLAPWAEEIWLPLLQGIVTRHDRAKTICVTVPADYGRLIHDAVAPHAAIVPTDDLMLRVADSLNLLHDVAPLLTARLRDADEVAPLGVRIGPLRGGMVLRVEGRAVAIDHPRRDDPYLLPEQTFLSLLLGLEGAYDQLNALAYPDEIRATLQTLFPPQDWVYWRSDAF